MKGKVEEFKQSKTQTGKDMFSFKIGELKYTGFGVPTFKNGDEIEFEAKDKTVGNVTYHNVFPELVRVISSSVTSGEMIGESARKKRISEMMMIAKDIITIAYRDEKLPGTKEEKVAEVTNKVKLVWKDLCRTIGETIEDDSNK